MNFMYMILEDRGRYYLKDTSNRSMDALYWFLMFESNMVHRLDSIIKWTNRDLKPQESIHTEFGDAYMLNNNVIVSSDSADTTREDVEIIIKKDAFMQLLNDWKKIYLKLPKEVTIYFDGERFTFDPVY